MKSKWEEWPQLMSPCSFILWPLHWSSSTNWVYTAGLLEGFKWGAIVTYSHFLSFAYRGFDLLKYETCLLKSFLWWARWKGLMGNEIGRLHIQRFKLCCTWWEKIRRKIVVQNETLSKIWYLSYLLLGQEILHLKVRKFATKVVTWQNCV